MQGFECKSTTNDNMPTNISDSIVTENAILQDNIQKNQCPSVSASCISNCVFNFYRS